LGDKLKKFSTLLVATVLGLGLPHAYAQEAGVLAVVNDQPVTNYDIDQRLNLLQVLSPGAPNPPRKKVANDLINDVVKIAEAKRNHLDATDQEVTDRLTQISKGMKTDKARLIGRLKARNVSEDAFRQYIAAQMAFGRLLQIKYKDKVAADPQAIDQKLATIKAEINGKVAKIMADPRMQPITVYSILEVNFPAGSNDPQMLQSRAIEANQYISRFKGCGSANSAASGIFNVKVGKKIEADGRKLPPQMKTLFNSRGPGHAYGPMRSASGVQVVAFCGTRTITPPKPKVQLPTRQQIENVVLNEQFNSVEQKYVAIMRKNAVILYNDPAYAE
jgi:peptidyl-prolyl cis-trans isomerase SurA